ncbi:tetratricopeptide repeat protein [Mobilitalea sibirica]|uniref:Tetratricopeptide repeat protein n=1 Tax=Mobilitalea sibirica TaxID=1462919 RepID=A0A8J7HBU9_9FIRM|nr:LuxR C-terminal-related transcriptional regulator [Mobilitalea sibirica]MBH1939649.1 tetratricopeptide repeat protein [Mobilitalea sibirica]
MNHLIPTKTLIPPLREGIVKRNCILDKLHKGLGRGNRLTLVTAFAGSGKTTLISQWIKEMNIPTGWVSLDCGDNHLYRFWEYIIVSLQTIDSRIGLNIQPALQSFENLSPETVINAIIRDLSEVERPMILVVDDYHVINNKDIHTSMNYFLSHMPFHLHLVIISREKAPLSLSRLRANLSITDILYEDLRFTKGETCCLMNTYLNIHLEKEDVKRLEEHTEGWVAGLQMAALSLEALTSSERHDFIMDFIGDDRYVFDYMAEIVLKRQAPNIQEFYLKTSILDRLSASLCNEVVGIKSSQTILEQLESSNLFLFSVDNRREWYRYHNLFTEFLRRFLKMQMSQEEIHTLYKKAMDWNEKNGFFQEAIHYAFVSEDYEYASKLIERNIWSTYYRSETQLVYGWLKALPMSYLKSSPILSAAYANCLLLTNKETISLPETRKLIEFWLQSAEAKADKIGINGYKQREKDLLIHYIRKLRIYYALFLESDPNDVIKMALSALEKLPENELMFRCAITYGLGRAYYLAGDTQAAIRTFESVRQIGKESGDLFNISAAIESLADIMYNKGSLLKASDICIEGITYLTELSGGRIVPYSGTIYITWGKIRMEMGDLEEAIEAIKKGIELLNLTSAKMQQQLGLIHLAYIYQALGKTKQAFRVLNEAICIKTQESDEVTAHKTRICLLSADYNMTLINEAEQWLKEQRLIFKDNRKSFRPNMIHDTAIRVMIDKYRLKLIRPEYDWSILLSYLDRQQIYASDAGWVQWEIEILLLKTRLFYVQGNNDKALQCLKTALVIGEKTGCHGVFIKEGQQMVQWLRNALKHKVVPQFVQQLMENFSCLLQIDYEKLINQSLKGVLQEPLSKRELEVLKLVASGYTNHEISKKLVISISTVKTHVYHIFEKFGVKNRTQAIAMARDLELIK